jgi:hypothetical protein
MRETDTATNAQPQHITFTDLEAEVVTTDTGHQRSARNNEDMRDGDSSHGSPDYEADTAEYDTDRDVGDTSATPEVLDEEEVGIVESIPANQDRQPPEADPPAHAGMDATAEVDEVIDERGTVETGDREDPSAENEFAATVGANSPAEPVEAGGLTVGDTPGRGLPIDGYERLTVRQVLAHLNAMPTAEIRQIRDYEQSHRRRKTLLVHLERRLQRDSGARHPTS